MKILYVEDDRHDIDLTRREITSKMADSQLDVVSTLAAARRQLETAPPYDAALLDLNLPDGSGLDLLAEIREKYPELTIIVLTGSGSEETAVAALKAGADDYILKRNDYLTHLPNVIQAARQRRHAASARRAHPLRVFYVEHNVADVDLTQRHLARYAPHIRLEIFYNVAELLAKLPPAAVGDLPPCDVILIDYKLPGLNALDALKIIHEERQIAIPIILVTGQGSEEIAVQALRLGAADYLVKHSGYLFELPTVLENAHHYAKLKDEQAALRQREQEFATLVENADDLIIRYDLNLRHLYVNQAVEKLTGIPHDQYLGKTNAESGLPPDLAAYWDQELQQVIATATPRNISLQLAGADGKLRHFEARVTPEFDDGDQVISLLSLARDITGRIEAEQKLRLQSVVLEAVANSILITDEQGTVEWVNPAFTRLSGYTLAEAVGKNPRDLIKSGLHEHLFYEDLWATIANGRVWQGEMINRRKNGELYHEEQTITPVIDEQGQITHFVAVKQDISERKEAEVTLAQSEKRFRALIEHSADVITLLDKDGIVLYESPSAQRILQYTVQQRVGKSIFDLLIDDDLPRIMRLFTEVLQQPRVPLETEFAYWHKDNSFHWAGATVTNLLDEPAVQAIVINYRDITNRKHSREALQQAQQLAQSTIDSLSAHIAVLGEDGMIMAVNQSWLNFGQLNNGHPDRIGVGMNYLAICDQSGGEDKGIAQQIATGIRAVTAGGLREFTVEYPCHAPDEKRWFVARITPLPALDLEMHWVVVAHENITQRKLAEEAALASERHYRLLFDSNPQPMWVYDLVTLAFLAVNDAAVDKYGYTREQFLDMTLKDIRPAEDIPRLLADVEQARVTLQRSGEWRHQLRDGRVIDIEIASHTLPFNGRDAALVVAFDITDRKQAEMERLAQTRRIQQILDTVPEGVVLINEAGRITLANPQGEEDLQKLAGLEVGGQIAELDGRPLPDILRSAAQATYSFEYQEMHFELLAQPIESDAPVTDWVLLLRNVTEEYEKQQYRQAQERLATVGQLAAGIAHDFNNVMAIIILYTQLVQQTADLSEKSQRYLRTIEEQAQHAANMISQILDFSRRSVIDRAPLNLFPLVKEIVKLLRNTLPETIDIELHNDANEYLLLADPTRLQQALMNMALNARDAMPDGGALRFTLRGLTIAPDQTPPLPDMTPGEWLQLTVTDTGGGIQPRHLPRLFTPFFTTKEVGKGAGLGLAQVHGIVKQHDGSIGVQSQVGLGTTFTIYLPLIDTAAIMTESAPPPETTLQGSETILLVEDNPTMRDSMRDALTGLNYRVIEADNGLTALSRIAAAQPPIDLVVSDIVMPEMGGLELYEALKEQRRAGLKMLLITGYPLDDTMSELRQSDWLQKPFDLRELARRVRDLLDG